MRPLGSEYLLNDLPLGSGAMGSVYLGEDKTGNRVAVKILHSHLSWDQKFVQQFLAERQLLKDVDSDYVVKVRDFVVENETLAIVMDYVDGPNLRDWYKAKSPLSPAEVSQIGAVISAGLSDIHELGIVHCDLKPDNILIDEANRNPVPKLADFGIANIAENTDTALTALSGTPQYLAPELYNGARPTFATDQYALGVLLYELVSGVPPYSGDVAALVRGHLDYAPGRPPKVPDELWSLIESLLSKRSADRPDSQQTSLRLDQLATSLANEPPAPRLSAPPPPVLISPDDNSTQKIEKTPSRSRLLLAGLAVLAVAVLVGFGSWTFLGSKGEPVAEPVAPLDTSPPTPTSSASDLDDPCPTPPSGQGMDLGLEYVPADVSVGKTTEGAGYRGKLGGHDGIGCEYPDSAFTRENSPETQIKYDLAKSRVPGAQFFSFVAGISVQPEPPKALDPTCTLKITDDKGVTRFNEVIDAENPTVGAVTFPKTRTLVLSSRCNGDTVLALGQPTLYEAPPITEETD